MTLKKINVSIFYTHAHENLWQASTYSIILKNCKSNLSLKTNINYKKR